MHNRREGDIRDEVPREHGVIRKLISREWGRGADGAISGPAGNYGSSAG